MNQLGQKRLHELIDEDFTHASVLFFFGISFFKHTDKTLAQVCEEKGLDLKTVVKNLEVKTGQEKIEGSSLQKYPVDLIIEYLKHSHFIFVKQKLPYISRLIADLDNACNDKIAKDLKFIFPFFVEDFIRHVYEEEDTLFNYILTLHSYLQNKHPLSKVYYAMEKHSIRDYALQHSMDDDEMQGIRELTQHYKVTSCMELLIKVIFQELKAFESELKNHARIENEILFPKALALENEVSQKLKSSIANN